MPGITLQTSLAEYASRLGQSDSACYLRVALNFSNGLGIVDYCKDCVPPQYTSFYFWAPGTPAFLGAWIFLTQAKTVLALFILFWLCFLVASSILLAAAYRYLTDFGPRVLAAISIAYCPPLLMLLHSSGLASSELVCFVPLASMIFCMSVAFDKLRKSTKGAFIWFALLGLNIGVLGFIRDSHLPFGTFIFLFLILGAIFKNYNLKDVVVSGISLLVLIQLTIFPVKAWNQKRIGSYIISSSSGGSIWRYGIWTKHDASDWYVEAGLGAGEYLDPDAAVAIEKYYQEGNSSNLYSMKMFALAILKKPLDFMIFKLTRLPTLFLGDTKEFPLRTFKPYIVWSSIFYFILFLYVACCWKRKIIVPEFTYLYLLYICCAAVLIHFEYRYTEAIWLSLIFVPSMLYQVLIDGRSEK